MRRFLALLFSLVANAALAQNVQCPTRAVGDSTNACASTAFVLNQIASGSGLVNSISNADGTLTIAPTTGVAVASLNLTHANTWTALQTFNGGAVVPTRAASDSTTNAASTAFVLGTSNTYTASNTFTPLQTFNNGIAAAATGVFTNTQQNDLSTSLLNGIVPATEFSGHQGGNFATEALAVGVLIPNTSTVFQVNGIASYVKSNAAQVSTGGYVGGYFSSFANANNANMFGINPVVGDVTSGLTGVKLQNEFDFAPANASTVVTGVALVMGGTVTPTTATAVAMQAAAGRQWGAAVFSSDGAAFQGAYLGTNSTANSTSSQALVFGGRDAGGTLRKPTILSDLNGALLLRGGQNGQAIALQDFGGGTGANILIATTSGLVLSGSTSGTTSFTQSATGGHLGFVSSSTPTLTAGCNGAGSVVSGTDVSGTITGQTAAATTCTLTFGTAFGAAPNCVAMGQSSPLTGAATPATGTLVVNFASTANYKFSYYCPGA